MFNTYKYKINIFDYQQIPEVRYIMSKIRKVDLKDREKYILDNKLDERLRNIYWETVYGSEEDFKIATELYEKIFNNNYDRKNRNELLNMLKDECIKLNKEYLFDKIDNICPNGDSVVSYTIMSLLE